MAGSATIGALRVVLGLDSAAFTSGLSAAQKHLKGVSAKLQSIGASMATVGAGMSAAITAPLIAAGFAASKAATEAADAMGQVEAALKSMGGASGKTQEELKGLASGLMRQSLYDDDEILRKVTSNLLTFGKIVGENFDRAQQAAVDLATRMNMDLQPATLLVGKALNDPIKGLTAMGRAGIQFTASQKATIKAMVEAGNAAGAQRIILGELEHQFGGAAAAAQATDPYDKLRDSLNNLSESAGAIINSFLVPLTDKLAGLLDRFNGLTPEVQRFVVIAAGIAAAIGPALILIGGMTAGVAALLPVIVAVGGAIASTFSLALAGLLTPLGLAIAAVAALAVGVVYLSSRATATSVAIRELSDIHAQGKTAIDKYREAVDLAAKANGRERKTALEAAAAKRQQVLEVIKSARAKLAEAQATLAGINAELELRMAKGFDPEGAAGQLAYLGRAQVLSQERAAAAAREIKGLLGQLAGIEKGAGAAVAPIRAVADAAETAGGKARAAKPHVRDFAEELKVLERSLMTPTQSAISDRTDQIKLLSDAFDKGALKAYELARMLRLLDEAQARDAFAATITPAPDQNPSLNDGPPSMTSFMGEVMSPETLADLRHNFQSLGMDFAQAVRDGDLSGFFMHLAEQFAAKLASDAFGSIFDALKSSGGGGGGGIGAVLGTVFGAMKIPGFKTGGSFKVGGAGGLDSQTVAFRATPGEMVDIRKPGNDNGQGGALSVHVTPSPYFDVQVKRVAGPMVAQGSRFAYAKATSDAARGAPMAVSSAQAQRG